MEQEVVDTTEAPAESAEPTEPTEVAEETVEEQTPAYITAEQMQEALAKQDSSFRSWLGRRDKETLNHIGNVINERLATKESPDEISSRLLENPRDVIRAEMKAYESERTQKQTTHLNTAMDTVGMLMESEPMFTDKDLGNEVVAEIGNMVKTGKIDSNVAPDAAGKIALSEAIVAVFRKRSGIKTNPLSGHSPGNIGPGLKPSVKPTIKPKVPKLDDETAKFAKRWGYSDEDLVRVLGE